MAVIEHCTDPGLEPGDDRRNLVTVTLDGKRYDAVAQVTKIGNTLLLDRVTGKPLFPTEEISVPSSDLAGEVASLLLSRMAVPVLYYMAKRHERRERHIRSEAPAKGRERGRGADDEDRQEEKRQPVERE